jgi:hypothetical protein
MRMLTGEGHESVVMMLVTGPSRQYMVETQRQKIWERLTLAVAVSGCASTVGVRALSAATHVDDVNWCLGVKRFGCCLVRLIEVV